MACALLCLGGTVGGLTASQAHASTRPRAGSQSLTLWAPGSDYIPGTTQGLATIFYKQTGIKVSIQRIPWSDYLTKLTTAITAGQLPDVAEIGNTTAASLAQSGAFLKWTKSRLAAVGAGDVVSTAMEVTGVAGQTPISLPLRAGTWVLQYNKALFRMAGISGPPTTWTQFYADAKKLSDPAKGVYGVAIAAGTPDTMNTFAWVLGQQYGVPYYDAKGDPDIATSSDVQVVKDLVGWVYPDQIMDPANVASANGDDEQLFDSGKAAMDFTQNPELPITEPGKYGLGFVPLPSPLPKGGHAIMSHIAGINLVVNKNSPNLSATMRFVKFLLSPVAQVKVAKGELSLPVTTTALSEKFYSQPSLKIWGEILSKYSAPTPSEASSAQLVNGMGSLVTTMYGNDVASRSLPSDSTIMGALEQLQQTVAASNS